MYMILSVAWLALWIGLAVGSVGQTVEQTTYSAFLPFSVLIYFGGTWVLGYLTGAEDN